MMSNGADVILAPDWRTQLNNYLIVNGGTQRLRWETNQAGPLNAPVWTAVAMS